MFSYYGGKRSIAHHYPIPDYDAIIEPFAGSAAYSLHYYSHKVILLDVSPIIARIWDWLLHEVTVQRILQWPELEVGDDIRKIKGLSSVEKELLGFLARTGASSPGHIVSGRAAHHYGIDDSGKPINRASMVSPRTGRKSRVSLFKEKARFYLPRIKHWRCYCLDYRHYKPNPKATWFIDPPYSTQAGRSYPFSDIDYRHLSGYCRSRKGQVIVCGDSTETWLPFQPLVRNTGNRSTNRLESIWTNA